eukprot:scaffold4985_cov116-Isochrysis_galbana.AAC.11
MHRLPRRALVRHQRRQLIQLRVVAQDTLQHRAQLGSARLERGLHWPLQRKVQVVPGAGGQEKQVMPGGEE